MGDILLRCMDDKKSMEVDDAKTGRVSSWDDPKPILRKIPKRNIRKPSTSRSYLARAKARETEFKLRVLQDYLDYLKKNNLLRESAINIMEQEDDFVDVAMMALDFSRMKVVSDTGLAAAPTHDLVSNKQMMQPATSSRYISKHRTSGNISAASLVWSITAATLGAENAGNRSVAALELSRSARQRPWFRIERTEAAEQIQNSSRTSSAQHSCPMGFLTELVMFSLVMSS